MVRLASGEVGGLYHAFARLLAAAAAGSDAVRIEPVVTRGSRENLKMLVRGDAELALTLADSVDSASGPIRALGRVYENYLQLVVLADSPIAAVTDLRGARVNLGAQGSGAALTGERIFTAAGLKPRTDITATHLPLDKAVTALRRGTVDALLWAGGLPTPGLEIPARMRLVDLADLVRPMRERFGHLYDRVTIPADAYPGARRGGHDRCGEPASRGARPARLGRGGDGELAAVPRSGFGACRGIGHPIPGRELSHRHRERSAASRRRGGIPPLARVNAARHCG